MTKQENIDEIMDHFDFGKVHKIMEAVDWTWANSEFGVPMEWELRKRARSLLSDAWDQQTMMSTGGFTARFLNEDESDGLQLEFTVEKWKS